MDYLNFNFRSYMEGPESGMDNLHTYKDHPDPVIDSSVPFITYPYPVYYKYNSRGFRGPEWPKDLSDVIWCLGDSFTEGIGVPFEHTWPSILQTKTKKHCINLGINGSANRLILNIAKQVISKYNPKYMVIMWSHQNSRYEDPWTFIDFDPTANDYDDMKEFLSCYKEVNNLCSNIYNTIIPIIDISDYKNLDKLLYTHTMLDVARDSWHFDYLTAEPIVESIISHFNFTNKEKR